MRTKVYLGACLIASFVLAQNVGIGTSTPAAKLDVFGPDGTYIRVSGNLPGGDSNQGLIGYEWANTSAGGYWRLYLADPDGGYGVNPRSLEFWEYPANLGAGGCCRPRLRILSSDGLGDPTQVVIGPQGNVGIGTTTPTQRLDVVGNVQFSGALMPGGNAGTPGQVLMSRGSGMSPVWSSFWQLAYVDAWNPSSTTSNGWTCVGCVGGPPYLTTCNSTRMLGGYNMCGSGCYFEKTYTSLPPHSEVMVEVFWWSVDSWDQHSCCGIDLISISIDGTVVSQAAPYGPFGTVGVRNSNASICGAGGWIDIGPQVAVGWATHSSSNVTIRVTNNVNSTPDDESMGIVMVRVWVK